MEFCLGFFRVVIVWYQGDITDGIMALPHAIILGGGVLKTLLSE